MIIEYWCGTCRRLHSTDTVHTVRNEHGAVLRKACPTCGAAVEPRAIPDDPDDPAYGAPRCSLCHALIRPGARFCTTCGAQQQAPTTQSPAAQSPAPQQQVAVEDIAPGGDLHSAQLVVQHARQRQQRERLVDILGLLANLPGFRHKPQQGDLAGDFDGWFDGGAVRYLTNLSEYAFDDGAKASVHDLSSQQIKVELADGARFTIEGPTGAPSFGDHVLAAVVVKCQGLLRALHTEDALPAFGQPPTQCMLVEKRADGARRDWLYDVTTNQLTQVALGMLDVSREPVNGMYYERGLITYELAQDQQSLEFSCVLGPRYGRGLRFELVETPEQVRLTQPTVLWVS